MRPPAFTRRLLSLGLLLLSSALPACAGLQPGSALAISPFNAAPPGLIAAASATETTSTSVPAQLTNTSVVPAPSAVPAGACGAYHAVQDGETLFRIGQQYGVNPDEIAQANGAADPGQIYAGQVLCIPTTGAILPAAPLTPTHTQPAAAAASRTPQITSFTVDRAQVSLGESVTLAWKTTGQSAQLCQDNVRSFPCLPVPIEGQQEFGMQFARRDGDSLPFILMAFPGPDWSGVPSSAALSVAVACPARWFFANPPDECARSPALESPAAIQPFEHGVMIWLEATRTIFVLWDQQGTPYTEVADVWEPGMPESDLDITPPPGFYQPARGFGMLWRGEAGDWSATLRNDLGWARQPETSYSGAFQCNAGYGDTYARCYLRGHEGQVFSLTRGHGYQWSVYLSPHGHWIRPWAHRQPPQAGKVLP